MTLVRERRRQKALTLSLPQDVNFRGQGSSSLSAVSPDSPEIEHFSDLEKLAVLGHGSGGAVYKVRHKRTASIFALKVLRFDRDTIAIRQRAAKEAEILKRVDSPYTVRCYAVFDREDELCFAMEYMEKGSLHDVLLLRKALKENVISGLAWLVIKGLQYLHGTKIVHGDIKPSNLLINAKGELKIADFGVSRIVMNNDLDSSDAYTGTCAYMSPERIDPETWGGNENGNGFAGDIWSLGVVVLECLVGHYPLIGLGEKPDWAALVYAICYTDRLEIPENASPEFCSFLGRCLEKDWRRRGTAEELLQHPFVAKTWIDSKGRFADFCFLG